MADSEGVEPSLGDLETPTFRNVEPMKVFQSLPKPRSLRRIVFLDKTAYFSISKRFLDEHCNTLQDHDLTYYSCNVYQQRI